MKLRHALLACGALTSVLVSSVAATAAVPPDFVVENAVPNTGFNNPTALAFTPDGRMLVAERRGVVQVVRDRVKLPVPLWNGEAEVLNNGDRGLLGIAVDPGYATNHYVYLLYTVDPDSNGVDDNDEAFGRLVRYRTSAEDSNVVDPASRAVLIGVTWREGFPSGGASHTVGGLGWGADGSLLVSCGEGANQGPPDAGGRDSLLFAPGRTDPNEDIGAFRAQYLESLAGKLLRVDPETGAGYPSNPYFDGDPRSNRSRVWAYGLRNPYRFCVRPGTGAADPAAGEPGALFIADVGWGEWEEIDVSAHGGENFGWPCHEGAGVQARFAAATPAHHGCGTIGTAENPAFPAPPTIGISHADSTSSTPRGLTGRCTVGGTFYTGMTYPPAYWDRLFFADFVNGWIKMASLDADQRLVAVTDFASEVGSPVDLAIDPRSGDLCYVSIYTGTLFRVRYAGAMTWNGAPVAAASGWPTVGNPPLTVGFSSDGSSDPDQDPLVFTWSFGDGTGSSDPSPSHSYARPGRYPAVLTVSDGRGAFGRDTVEVVVRSSAGFPATLVLDDFERADGPIGRAWVGNTSVLAVAGGALVQTESPAYAIWNGAVAGPDQEVHATFEAVTDGTENDLLLEVQGESWQDGHVQVHYDTRIGGVIILTYDRASGWRRVGGPFPERFLPGDRFGGRALANGVVEAYRNGVRIGSASVGDWPHPATGGRVGLMMVGAQSTRLADFGGGDLVIYDNSPPEAAVVSPHEGMLFADGDTIRLSGVAEDGQQPSDQLRYRWVVNLEQDGKRHLVDHDLPGREASFVARADRQEPGDWYQVLMLVSDAEALTDTAEVCLYPDVNLEPGPVAVLPETLVANTSAAYRFTIRNRGRMPAATSHWHLIAGATLLAEGDTRVGAADSATVELTLPTTLPPGSHDLRLVVDSLGAVQERSEVDNAVTRTVMVMRGKPTAVFLSRFRPNPGMGEVHMDLELPHEARIAVEVYDAQGRRVCGEAERPYAAGRWELAWTGQTTSGARARPGIYLARVTVDGRNSVRRVTLLR